MVAVSGNPVLITVGRLDIHLGPCGRIPWGTISMLEFGTLYMFRGGDYVDKSLGA